MATSLSSSSVGSSPRRWSRLVRYLSPSTSLPTYGDLLSLPSPPSGTSAAQQLRAQRVRARPIRGDPLGTSYELGGEADEVELGMEELLCPLEKKDVPIIRMVGLNYAKHVAEAKMPTPTSPALFVKPRTAAAAPFAPVPVPALAQTSDSQLDYEGELVLLIGKDCRDVAEEDAEGCIAGYAVGNDVSCRKWQMINGTQWSFSKGFDGWAPFGPCITRSDLVDPLALRLTTTVNGSVRQDSSTSDLVHSPARIVAFFSQGTTLEAGTLIFTGTPAGVVLGMPEPKPWLRDGDEVTVQIEGLGAISNKMAFV